MFIFLYLFFILYIANVVNPAEIAPFSLFYPDGKYCLIEKYQATGTKGQTCKHSIVVNTKFPFLILSLEDEDYETQRIYVIRPDVWPEVIQPSSAETIFEFTLFNVTHHSLFKEESSLLCAFKKTGVLFIQPNVSSKLSSEQSSHPEVYFKFKRIKSHSFKNVIRHSLCHSNNLLPGKWKFDPTHMNYEEDKWNSCPEHKAHSHRTYECPKPYYASHYYPNSECFILPLRVSLYLLKHLLEMDLPRVEDDEPDFSMISKIPYYTFIGDSLNGQILIAGNCELEKYLTSNDGSIHSISNASTAGRLIEFANIKIKPIWKQFLRNDLPCYPKCLTNQTFLITDGQVSRYRYLPSPCKGCPDGIRSNQGLFENADIFSYFKEIPHETRILVLNAGVWFTKYFSIEEGTLTFSETLLALLPHLLTLQQERNYYLDIYFLSLPFVDPELGKNEDFEWKEYSQRNQIIEDIMVNYARIHYNLSITVIPNEQLFLNRKRLFDSGAISAPDNLHYCVPGSFSAPTFLFELILHHHISKRVQELEI